MKFVGSLRKRHKLVSLSSQPKWKAAASFPRKKKKKKTFSIYRGEKEKKKNRPFFPTVPEGSQKNSTSYLKGGGEKKKTSFTVEGGLGEGEVAKEKGTFHLGEEKKEPPSLEKEESARNSFNTLVSVMEEKKKKREKKETGSLIRVGWRGRPLS